MASPLDEFHGKIHVIGDPLGRVPVQIHILNFRGELGNQAPAQTGELPVIILALASGDLAGPAEADYAREILGAGPPPVFLDAAIDLGDDPDALF